VYQHAPTPDAPGIYRHRLYLAELVRRGWAVDLVSTPRNYMTGEVPARYRGRLFTGETIDGIRHHWVWASGGIHRSRVHRALNYASFVTAAGVRAALLPRPDVILVSSPPLPVGTVGPALAGRFRRPWVLEVRDVWPESAVSVGWLRADSGAYRALERLAHRLTSGAAAVVIPTPGLSELVAAHGARRIETVTGAVQELPRDPGRRAEVRSRLGVGEACLFVYLGAIGVANGLDLLVDAVRLLPPETAARFVVAGDGSAREELARRVRDERLTSVELLGPVGKDEVQDLLLAADVGLHLLRRDEIFRSALPTKVLEYFGAHLPLVTTVEGLPTQLARESGGGAAYDADALALELARWAGMDPRERTERGEEAFAYGSGRFGLVANADRLERLLVEVAEGRASAPAR
jgi:glycosyltransferase involved in cell wall biosynthesis